jgi:hypothetical protein
MDFDYGVFDRFPGVDEVRGSVYSVLGYEEDEVMDGLDDSEPDYSHLDVLDDGCGCAEVWEELQDQRSDLSSEDLE